MTGRKSWALMLIGLLLLALVVSVGVIAGAEEYWGFEDDFNYTSDTEAQANWYILRAHPSSTKEIVWNPAGSYVYITTNDTDSTAALLLRSPPMTAYRTWMIEAIIFIGNQSTSYPADGMAIVFYHNNQLGLGGGDMGARLNGSIGYLLEFDPYQNTGEPTVPHIALANATTPMYEHMRIYYTGPILDQWMFVRITFNYTAVTTTGIIGVLHVQVWDGANRTTKTPEGTLIVDDKRQVVFSDTDTLLGFSAATGLYAEEHKVDWVHVVLYSPISVGGVIVPSQSGATWSSALLMVGMIGLALAAAVVKIRYK